MPDLYSDFDIIIGPIANDTIYDTMGIMTSGFLSDDEALKLLCVGPQYTQIVLKSRKAADKLRFLSAEILSKETIEKNKETAAANEADYLKLFAQTMESLGD